MELLGQENPAGGKPVLPYRTPLAVITQDHAPSGRKAAEPRHDEETGGQHPEE